MKKLFALMLAGLSLTACSDDNDEPAPAPAAADRTIFIGTLDVTPQEGSPFKAFSAEGIEFGLRPQADGRMTLVIPKIKFVEQMPVWIAFEVPDLTPVAGTGGSFSFAVASTLPYWNGAPFDPDKDGRYEITNLDGRCDAAGRTLRVTFDCYTMQVDYRGAWSPASLGIPSVK